MARPSGGVLATDYGGRNCGQGCQDWVGAPVVADNTSVPAEEPSWSTLRHAVGTYEHVCEHTIYDCGVVWRYEWRTFVEGPGISAWFYYQLWLWCVPDEADAGSIRVTAMLGYTGPSLLIPQCFDLIGPFTDEVDVTDSVTCADGVLSGTFDLPTIVGGCSGYFTVTL